MKMTGYFKFQPGTEYTSGIDKSKNPPIPAIDHSMNGKDKGDIYAILYEAENVEFFLDGYNSLSSSTIISLARISPDKMVKTSDWTFFDLELFLKTIKQLMMTISLLVNINLP